MIEELDQQRFTADPAVRMQCEAPDLPLHGLIHVKLSPVRAHLDPVGRPHICRDPRQPAVAIHAPHLTGFLFPVRIAGENRSIRSDSYIVGLVHLIAVCKYRDRFRLWVDAQDVVIRMVSDEHDAGPIEADAVGQAAVRELDENFTFPIRRNLAYGGLARKTHGKDIAGTVASGAFNFGCKAVLRRQRPGNKEFFGWQ